MDRKRRKTLTRARAHTHTHTERERERERESCGYIMYNPRKVIEKWLKDEQSVRRFNDESVRKRPLDHCNGKGFSYWWW